VVQALENLGGQAVHLHYELYENGKVVNPAATPNQLKDPQMMITEVKDINENISNQPKSTMLPEVIVYGKNMKKPTPMINIFPKIDITSIMINSTGHE
jgi:hypothetical protein